jgi:hypothetical protein
MATIQDLANSIAQMEGFNTPGSIANRYNNPGNLRYAATQNGSAQTASGTFATFATPEDGWAALNSYIDTKANSGQTLRDFIYVYAPPVENNTSSYLNYLSGQLGIGADQSLGDLLNVSASSVDITGGSGSVVDSLSNITAGLDSVDPTMLMIVVGGLVVVGIMASQG